MGSDDLCVSTSAGTDYITFQRKAAGLTAVQAANGVRTMGREPPDSPAHVGSGCTAPHTGHEVRFDATIQDTNRFKVLRFVKRSTARPREGIEEALAGSRL